MFDRARFLQTAITGVFSFTVGGSQTLLNCAQARAAEATLDVLTADERSALEAICDTLLPGARDAGVAYYIDRQLSVEPQNCLLILRYLEYREPFAPFSRSGLRAIDAASRHAYGVPFDQLRHDQRDATVQSMIGANPPAWQGVPAPLFDVALRSAYGLFDDETEPYICVTGGSLMSQDHYGKVSQRGYYGRYQWLIAQAMKPNDLLGIGMSRTEVFGDALHAFMRNAAHHLGTMALVGEDHPLPENRLTLSSETDRFGMALARTEHAFTADPLQ